MNKTGEKPNYTLITLFYRFFIKNSSRIQKILEKKLGRYK